MTSADALSQLIRVSRMVGGDENLVQAGGGNASVKTDRGAMLIKASGTPLGGLSETSGWIEVSLDAIFRLLDSAALRALPASEREAELIRRMGSAKTGGPGMRPSVECCTHALLGRVVIHTHAVRVNALTCAAEGERLIRERLRALWMPYCDPGFPLAAEVKRAISSPQTAIVQQNHGIFVAGADADEALARQAGILAVCPPLSCAFPPRPAVDAAIVTATETACRSLPGAQAILARGSARPDLAAPAFDAGLAGDLDAGPLTPDQIVYAGPAPLEARPDAAGIEAAVQAFHARWHIAPKVVIFEGAGAAVLGMSPAAMDAAEATAAASVRTLAAMRAQGLLPRPMRPRDVAYIMDWEVERYRAKQI